MKIRVRQKLLIAIPSIVLTAILLLTFIPVVVNATITVDNPLTNPDTEPSYQVGDEIVSERGRAHRVYYIDAVTSEAVFSGSPEFTSYNGEWVDYVFTDAGNYYQVQHPWSSVRFYDYYTEVWNEEFTEVKIYDDRWTVEYQNKQGNWVDSSFWGITKSYEYVSDGIKLKRIGSTDIGRREEIYYFRHGSPCKITINQTCDDAQNIRFVWNPSGIVAATEYNIVEEFGEYTGRISGLNYYDSEGRFVETIRWYDALSLTDSIDIVAEASAQGRKATVTFGGFAIDAGGIACLDPETFYPDAHEETSTVDGRVDHNLSAGSGVAWATLIAAAGVRALDDRTGEPIYIKADSGVSKWIQVTRSIFLFDTSGLPDGASITASTLSLHGYDTKSDGLFIDAPDVCVYSSDPANNDGLEAGDYDSLGSTDFSDVIDYTDWVDDNWNTLTLNEAGRGAISKTTITKLGLRDKTYDVLGAVPNWENNQGSLVNFYMAEQGEGFKPKLVVTYTLPAPPVLPRVPAVPLTPSIGEGMSLIMASCAVGLFSVFGFWRRNALLFMLAGGASLMVGLQWYNVFVTSTGLTIGLMLIAYALACLAFAFRYLFWRDRLREE